MKTVKIPSEGYGSNCWLIIEDGGEMALVDPSPDAEVIAARMASRGFDIKKLRYILLTHGHFDHIGGADGLRDISSAPLCVHSADADCLTTDANEYMYFFRESLRLRPAERLLSDGDVLPLGEKSIKVIHTPGHTKGSVCYVTEDAVYSGDTLFDCSIGRTDLTGGSLGELRDSLKELCQLDGSLKLYPGHGSLSTMEKQFEFNPYLKGMLKR